MDRLPNVEELAVLRHVDWGALRARRLISRMRVCTGSVCKSVNNGTAAGLMITDDLTEGACMQTAPGCFAL